MRVAYVGFGTALVLAIAGPSGVAFAQNADPAQLASITPSRLKPEARVCKWVNLTGTRLKHAKLCKTRAEWAEISLSMRKTVEKVQTTCDQANC